MAEHYGTVPKRFSKEWWPYFWMYYKWHTIGVAFAFFAILITAVQCATKPKYDLTVNYFAEVYYPEETLTNVANELTPYIEDLDGNGEKSIFIQQMNIGGGANQAEMDYAMQVKHDMQLTEASSYVYIYDTAQAELMFGRESAGDIYENVSSWTDDEYPADMLICADDGTPVGVSLKNSTVLKNAGINADDLFIGVTVTAKDDDGGIAHESAVKLANALLK